MKRTCTPKQVQQIQYETLDWTGTWAEAFGRPEVNETWFVMGPSAGGKSSFVMQLAKQLCKTGKVLSVAPSEDRAIVEGINMVSKHTKPNSKQPQGGIIKQEASIHISNLNLIDPKSQKPTRVGYKMDGDKKIRYAKKSGEEIK